MSFRHLLCLMMLLASGACANEPPRYGMHHSAEFDPSQRKVLARLTLTQGAGEVEQFDFNAPSSVFSDFSGDGTVRREKGRLIWQPPKNGGALAYTVEIDSRRGERYDARFTETRALARLGDLFPPARVTTATGARSRSSFELTGPDDWSFVTRYEKKILDDRTDRRYVRPTGWMLGGDIGVRREQIAGHTVIVAGPKRQGVRRLDILTFLRFTLPTLSPRLSQLPEQVLIVSAADQMWRGALSGPGSLFVHADRPLVSGNGTSTFLHELVHVGGGYKGDDWLVEGLAEYIGLQALRDSGGLSAERYQLALDRFHSWAQRDGGALRDPSHGADTACAVWTLARLDQSLPGGLGAWLAEENCELRGASLRAWAKQKKVEFPGCRSNED